VSAVRGKTPIAFSDAAHQWALSQPPVTWKVLFFHLNQIDKVVTPDLRAGVPRTDPMKTISSRVVACPQCRSPVAWTEKSPWRPFCSERCRTIDQGAWASESYRVAAVDPPDDFEAIPPSKDA
jgi:endogenous inhibitor of DNA gyrase (YacG/DUF329 family)